MTFEELDAFAATTPTADCRVFLLGQFAQRITLRSQQLRAFNLACGLKPRITGASQVCVIGGGVAGLSVAAALAEWTLADRVDVFERAPALLSLQRHCKTRFLHPYVIEWPFHGDAGDDANLPLLNWQAGYADQVSQQLLAQWEATAARWRGRVHAYLDHRVLGAAAGTGGHVRIDGSDDRQQPLVRDYDLVIVASGFGHERQVDLPTPLYWENDAVDQLVRDARALPGGRRQVLVSGTGDGGLIDVLRCALSRFRHDDVLDAVLRGIDPATLEHLKQLDRQLLALDVKDGAAVQRYIADFRALPVPAIDDYLRGQQRPDTRTWLAGRHLPHPCLAANANLMHRLLVSRLLELQHGLADPAFIYVDGAGEPVWHTDHFEAVMAGGVHRFDAVFIRRGTHLDEQPLLQALAAGIGLDIAALKARAQALAPPNDRFRADLSYRYRSLTPPGSLAALATARQTALTPTLLGDLVTLWLSASPTQLVLDRLDAARKGAAPHTELERFVLARLHIMTAEQYTKLRLPGPAQDALDAAGRTIARARDTSPQCVQCELDLEWLQQIVHKFNGRHDAAVQGCEDALRHIAARAAAQPGDGWLAQQLDIHRARIERSLLTYLAESGDFEAGERLAASLVGAAVDLVPPGWKALDTAWLADCHLLPRAAMARLLAHERFQFGRRLMDLWLQVGDTAQALAAFKAFESQYFDAVDVGAMDNITKLNFFRLVGGLCARAAVGADAVTRAALLDSARQCFGVSRLAAAGQNLPTPVRIRDAYLRTLVGDGDFDSWQSAAHASEQASLVQRAHQALAGVRRLPPAPVHVAWRGATPGLARAGHAARLCIVHRPGGGFADAHDAAQCLLARASTLDAAGLRTLALEARTAVLAGDATASLVLVDGAAGRWLAAGAACSDTAADADGLRSGVLVAARPLQVRLGGAHPGDAGTRQWQGG